MTTVIKALTVATAGHVDHGKTSLVRRLTEATGMADPGMTIDLGYAYRRLDDPEPARSSIQTLGFVDVPGHANFIGNMLCGVGSVDAVLLAVAADDGVMPQTIEHAAILDLLGVCRGVVALTKSDVVDRARIQEVSRQVNELLRDTSLGRLPVIAVSSRTGQGIDALVEHFTLLLQSRTTVEDSAHHPRFFIDRSFTLKGIGTVVTGFLRNGSLIRGQFLHHSASGQPVRIKGIRHHTVDQSLATAGQRLALQIDGHYSLYQRGHWLGSPQAILPTRRLQVRFRTLVEFTPRSATTYHLYLGAQHTLVTMARTGGAGSPFYRLHASEPVLAWVGDHCVLLDPSGRHALAGGEVVDLDSSRNNYGVAARLKRLKSQTAPAHMALLTQLSDLEGGIGMEDFARSRGLTAAAALSLVDSLPPESFVVCTAEGGQVTPALPWLLHRRHFDSLRHWVLEALQTHHEEFPQQPGLEERTLILRADPAQRKVLPLVLTRLRTCGEVTGRAGFLALPHHKIILHPDLLRFMDRLYPLLAEAGFVAPRTRELAETLNLSLDSLQCLLKDLEQAALLVRVAPNRHYLPQTLTGIQEFVEQLVADKSQDPSFSVIEFRDASGIGRNLCIELLEYFDSVGFTRRAGNRRFMTNRNPARVGISGDTEPPAC
ncbi:MAG: hypothetical protein RLZZ385_491 [Pseudomonadota bacterium]|jgi:selenocysteine-specific elongation factor